MDVDELDSVLGEYDETEIEQLRERQLLADEQPLDFDEQDCEGCKI